VQSSASQHRASPSEPLLDPSVRSLLLVRLRVGLGDLLCTVPAVRALRAARPDLHVALATWPEMAGVVARTAPWVDELVPFPGAPGIPERVPDGTLPQWQEAMAARRWDLALQVYGDNPAANAVTAATGARLVGGFAATGAPGLDPALHVPYPHALHEVDRHLRLLEHLGLPPGASRTLEWPLTADDLAEAAALGLPRGAYAVLHPGATSPSRLWPVERFAEVADGLSRAGLEVVVGGVPSEAATTGAVVAASRAPVRDLTGRTSLGAYAALLRDAAVVVANDTGTAHLSAAVGGRVVTVFLSGDPRRWRHAADLQAVVREEVGCNPCPHLVCPIDHRCARRISPDRVLREALVMAGLTAGLTAAPTAGPLGGTPPTPAAPSAARSAAPALR
jgi:ADP-heptose:LPS heptosyltransferase